MDNIIEFSRGDGATHNFYIPVNTWSAGGKLFFAAKLAIDDDATDALSLVNGGPWDDSNITEEVTRNNIVYKKYSCYFPGSATDSIPSGGAEKLELLGEFQFVPVGSDPMTFPATDSKLDCVVYMDVKRKTT